VSSTKISVSPAKSAKKSRKRKPAPKAPLPLARSLDLRRVASTGAIVAAIILVLRNVASAVATLVTGWLVQDLNTTYLQVLGFSLVGGAILYVVSQVIWTNQCDKAEGQLRADLLAAALAQPLAVIAAQSSGEILDRVDDDAAALGRLIRGAAFGMFHTCVGAITMWIVAGISWWPAWFMFPLFLASGYFLVRKKLPIIKEKKVEEEIAWTNHAAAFEEAVAARDDLRTNNGQAFAVRRLAELSAQIFRRVRVVAILQAQVFAVSGVALHAILGLITVAGVIFTIRGALSVGQLVTVFLATASLAGLTQDLIGRLPEIQEGLGAMTRIKQLLEVEPEPVGGVALPGQLDLEFRNLDFAYPVSEEHSSDTDGTATSEATAGSDAAASLDATAESGPALVTTPTHSFALREVNIYVPAGQTIALVGRTGSGKTTLASLLSRAVEPNPATVFLGGHDVLDYDLSALRRGIGVVSQRTEILAGTLRDNVTLFGAFGSTSTAANPGAADVVAADPVAAAMAKLGLTEWVAALPDGLETLLGPGGTKLSAGEEQLVAFARLLVRDVHLVILDEATARMDPLTERRVIAAAHSLLSGRTGVVIAHRLATIERADLVAVLSHGEVIQQGSQAALAAQPGPYRDLIEAAATGDAYGNSADLDEITDEAPALSGTPNPTESAAQASEPEADERLFRRRNRTEAGDKEKHKGMKLMPAVRRMWFINWQWGLIGVLGFFVGSLFFAQGPVTGYLWGRIVEGLEIGRLETVMLIAMIALLVGSRLAVAYAVRVYGLWWTSLNMRVRMAVMRGQIAKRRLAATPPGEVVARAMDSDRFIFYADRWFDFANAILVAVVVTLLSRSWMAGLVILGILAISAVGAVAGRRIAGRTAKEAAAARAQFGRVLVSVLDGSRTVKLAAATAQVEAYLARVDSKRVRAAMFEHRVRAILDGIPAVLCFGAAAGAWVLHQNGYWSLATTLMVSNTAIGYIWFAMTTGGVVNDAPGVRSWQIATQDFAGGRSLVATPAGVSLVTGAAPAPSADVAEPLSTLELRDYSVQFDDDGSTAVSDVNLTVTAGQVVLLLGQVGSGKSALLSALAGLRSSTGEMYWNGAQVSDPEVFLRPRRVAYVSQLPRVVSGTIAENIQLDHAARPLDEPVTGARLDVDVTEAGGLSALVGHRGVKLSGGQSQRLALARALATQSAILVADDISSALDAATELELWQHLRANGQTVIGSTSKLAALALADQVVVIVDGRVVATGPWADLAPAYAHLAS
jgi:ABC-type multidrug transport system fused ATPase/permease subunit